MNRGGVLDDGQRHRHALVARTRVDDDGQGAAAHARIGPRSRAGAHARRDIGRVHGKDRAADLASPVAAQALFRHGGVAVDLALKQGLYAFKIDLAGKRADVGHGKAAVDFLAVGVVALVVSVALDRLAVACDVDDVGVAVAQRDRSGVARARHLHDDEEVRHAFDKLDLAETLRDKGLGTLDDLGRHRLEDLELTVGVAAEKTEHGRHLDALEAARVGHDDALDVLDDVAAAAHDHVLDGLAERATGKRRSIGQGDGLGAAQCAHEFFAEQLNEQGRGLLIGRCGHAGAPSISKPYLRVEEIPSSTWVFACRHHTI